MERLESMKEQLMSCVESQLTNLAEVDAHELGEAIDMIKDLSQTMYYCSVVKAMETNSDEGATNARYYTMPHYPLDEEEYWYYYPKRDIDKIRGKMYYGGEGYSKSRDSEREVHDVREGRSGARRRMYMESKELHQSQEHQLKDLENYLQELSTDVTEMIEGASLEERKLLEKKMADLANKIAQLNVKN